MQTVLETPQFARQAEAIFTDEERQANAVLLAFNPLAGAEVVGTGGVRKIRFGYGGKGKRGGSRIISFFFSEHAPIYQLACYAKNRKENLTRGEITAMKKLTAAIKDAHRKRTK
jgi:hypothetical protein